jgi:hypothetical protein
MGAFAAVAGVAFACSSTPGPLYPQISDFCNAYASATCGESTNCATPMAACVNEQAQICTSSAQAATSDGNRQYTAANAPACVNQAQSVYSNAVVSFASTTSLLATCANVFVGSVALGGACSSNYDCVGAYTGTSAAGVICDQAKCVQESTVQAGPTGYCGEPGQVCATGSYCNTAKSPAVCTLGGSAGTPCNVTTPCGPSLRCAGVCEPLATQGETCTQNSDCDPSVPFCDVFDGFVCTTGLIFSPAEKALCQNFGAGTATPFDAGPPPAVSEDSGTATTDSSSPTDSGGGGG